MQTPHPLRQSAPSRLLRTRGVTVIELAIAILVVTLLVVIGLPAYQSLVTRQIVEEAVDLAAPAKQTIQEYASFHGKLPATGDVALPFVTSQYVTTTSWSGSDASGTISVATRSGQHGELDGKAVALTAVYNPASRSVEWTCGGTPGTTVAKEYLPDGCVRSGANG